MNGAEARQTPFDLVVVGAGIVGVLAAVQAVRRHPAWRVLLVDRSLVGSGATRYSAGLAIPFGRNEDHRRMERESTAFFHELRAALPGLPVRELPFYGVAREAIRDEIRSRCTVAGLREVDGAERARLATVFPGLRLAEDQRLLGGVQASYALADPVTSRLALGLAGSERATVWEGVEITALHPLDGGVSLSTADGREIAARRAILAPGPWALGGPAEELARRAGIRTKKIVALHLDLCPGPDDPVLLFFDDDAFLLPVLERRHWLFSFTCQVWDCPPEASELRITAEDREAGLAVLRQYCPRFAELCTSGRVFCDSYGPQWIPIVTSAPEAPQIVLAAGCSGGGYRLAPAIARQALDAVAGNDLSSSMDPERKTRRWTMVATPPLTPNGDIHLGHLSGPYLGADVLTRYLRLRGGQASHTTGVDDYQSYVAFKADRIGSTPAAVADRHCREIQASFRAAQVDYDLFLRAEESPVYVSTAQEVARKLYQDGKVVVREKPCPYCEHCQRFLFEAYVVGRCPHCGEGAGGNVCEGCGRPNEGADLIDPVCSLCQRTPVMRPLPRLVFPMAEHADALREFVARASMPIGLRSLCESVLAEGLPDVMLTRLADWGIPVPVPGLEGQVLSTWFELAPSPIAHALELGERRGWPAEARDFLAGDLEVVNFFGFDNSFFYALLVPALLMAYRPGGRPPSTFVTNEFYRLDGLKFSTSRNHATWASEVLARVPADLVRFYLCLTRPEREQTSFTESDFQDTVKRELGLWQSWLQQLGGRLGRLFDGIAPEPGFWTPEQRDFYRDLQTAVAEVGRSYEPETFSLRRVARLLCELVRRTHDFGTGEVRWERVARRRNELRSALALELAAARALALLSAPMLPRFSAELWRALGNATPLEQNGWEEIPDWVPPATRVDLARDFFAFPEGW